VATSPNDSIWQTLQEQLASKNTVALYMYGKWYYKSNAVLKICAHLGFPLNLLNIFRLIPAFIRNGFYHLIAKNRYRWFGEKSTCMVPTTTEKAYFIDCPTPEMLNFPQKK
jgi:predicted DCC family thiol-disulfide oxidoreductase YuxK